MTEEEYIEYIEWRAEQERKMEMTDIRYLVRPLSEIYTKEEVKSAKDEIKLLQSEFDECVKMMSDPVIEDNTEKKKTRKFFIAKCGKKYLFRWDELNSSTYEWFDMQTEFDTKEECLQAAYSAMKRNGRPNEPILIKEVTETKITEVSNEEYLSDETLEKLHEEAQQSGDR